MTLLELKEKVDKFIIENPYLVNTLELVTENDFGATSYFGDFQVMFRALNENGFWHLYTESEVEEREDLQHVEKVIYFN